MSDGNQGRNRTHGAPPPNQPPAGAATPAAEPVDVKELQESFARLSETSAAEAGELRNERDTYRGQSETAIAERDDAVKRAEAAEKLANAANEANGVLRKERDEARADAEALAAELTEARSRRSRRGSAEPEVITRVPSKERKAAKEDAD